MTLEKDESYIHRRGGSRTGSSEEFELIFTYDTEKEAMDVEEEIYKNQEYAEKYKLMIGDLDTGGTSEAEAIRLYNNERIVKRLEEEKKLFEKDIKTLEVKEKEIVDELGKDDHLLTFAVRFYVLRCNQTLKRIMEGKE